MSTVFIIYVCS